MPDVPFGGGDGLHRLLALLFVAFHFEKNARALAVGRQQNLGHVAQSNPRIAQVALDNDADLVLERLAYPSPMMLFATLFWHLFYVTVKNP